MSQSPLGDFKFRTPTFSNLRDEHLKIELDRALPRLYDAHAALNATALTAPTKGAGFSAMSGSLSVTGSQTGIATGLATVEQAIASIANGATATNFWATCEPSPGTLGAIDIYIWMPTAMADTTPTAAITAVSVHWWATGTATSPT